MVWPVLTRVHALRPRSAAVRYRLYLPIPTRWSPVLPARGGHVVRSRAPRQGGTLRATGNTGRGVTGLGHAPRVVVVGRHPTPGCLLPPPRDARTSAPFLDPRPYCRALLLAGMSGVARARGGCGSRFRLLRLAMSVGWVPRVGSMRCRNGGPRSRAADGRVCDHCRVRVGPRPGGGNGGCTMIVYHNRRHADERGRLW